jgi:hypothetical protein
VIPTAVADSWFFWLAIIGGLAGVYILPTVIGIARQEGQGCALPGNIVIEAAADAAKMAGRSGIFSDRLVRWVRQLCLGGNWRGSFMPMLCSHCWPCQSPGSGMRLDGLARDRTCSASMMR